MKPNTKPTMTRKKKLPHCSGCTDPDPLGATHSEQTIEHPEVLTKDTKKPICCRCDKPATTQTESGKSQESLGALPINHGWYCDKCFKEGLKAEMEAMYG